MITIEVPLQNAAIDGDRGTITITLKDIDDGFKKAGIYMMPEWVSVKDRMPEEKTKVLVFGRNEFGAYCVTCYYSGARKWLFHNKTTKDGETITHWMNLPNPPEDEYDKETART